MEMTWDKKQSTSSFLLRIFLFLGLFLGSFFPDGRGSLAPKEAPDVLGHLDNGCEVGDENNQVQLCGI